MEEKVFVGGAEYIWLVKANIKKVPARIDTGARTTSIWASDIKEQNGTEYFKKIVVASSNGTTQIRYYIPITIQMKKRRILTHCTLSDRSSQAYPVLIGRNTLRGKFIVDVQRGSRILGELDKKRFEDLQTLLTEGVV